MSHPSNSLAYLAYATLSASHDRLTNLNAHSTLPPLTLSIDNNHL